MVGSTGNKACTAISRTAFAGSCFDPFACSILFVISLLTSIDDCWFFPFFFISHVLYAFLNVLLLHVCVCLLCNIIILYETFLNYIGPRHSVSYLCQEYASNKIDESIRDLMLVSIKV